MGPYRVGGWIGVVVLFGALSGHAMTPPPYDVLCDSTVGIRACHHADPRGKTIDFPMLRAKLNGLGAGTLFVSLTNGGSLESSRFSAIGNTIVVGRDTLDPREIRSLFYRGSWPEWRGVATITLLGAYMFGFCGAVVDGAQGVSGSGWDLGATSTGALVGAAVFGGLGLWFARERYEVMIQEGVEQRVVRSDSLIGIPDDLRTASLNR